MSRGKKIYEGKAKILYAGPERGTYIQYFKDDATAFNNLKKAVIDGKGVLNNRISEFLLTQLNEMGIETHLIKRVNMREQLIKKYLTRKELDQLFNLQYHTKNVNYIFSRVFKS